MSNTEQPVPAPRADAAESPAGDALAMTADRTHPVVRALVVWVLTAGTLLLMGALLSDVTIDDVAGAFASALIGLVNALVWPLIIRLRCRSRS